MNKRNQGHRRSSHRAQSMSSKLQRLIEDDAVLRSPNQLSLMYDSFQSEMPSDGRTGIGTWLRDHLTEYGMPSLVRFGPRSHPQVLRKDEFVEWFRPFQVS